MVVSHPLPAYPDTAYPRTTRFNRAAAPRSGIEPATSALPDRSPWQSRGLVLREGRRWGRSPTACLALPLAQSGFWWATPPSVSPDCHGRTFRPRRTRFQHDDRGTMQLLSSIRAKSLRVLQPPCIVSVRARDGFEPSTCPPRRLLYPLSYRAARFQSSPVFRIVTSLCPAGTGGFDHSPTRRTVPRTGLEPVTSRSAMLADAQPCELSRLKKCGDASAFPRIPRRHTSSHRSGGCTSYSVLSSHAGQPARSPCALPGAGGGLKSSAYPTARLDRLPRRGS